MIPVPLSELNHDAEIKEGTERTLDIRTTLLVVRGAQIRQDSIALANQKAATIKAQIGEAAQTERADNCEDNYRDLDTKRKVGNGIQYTIIALEAVAIALLVFLGTQ